VLKVGQKGPASIIVYLNGSAAISVDVADGGSSG
jgi:hypothetical protein